MQFESDETEKFNIVEVDVTEEREARPDFEIPTESEKETWGMTRQERRQQRRGSKKPKFSWAFFLFSLFIGLGITATIDAPLPLFVGLGVGFLFFVDPIYEAVMRRINKL